MTTRNRLTNKRTAHSRVSVHVRCVLKVFWVLVVTLSLVSCSVSPRRRNTLDGHVVIGVVLGFTTPTQYQVQISFLLDFVVYFCTCSQTVFCDRQFLSAANHCTFFAYRNRVILRCCLYTSRPVTVDRRQL